jgi:serine/threonine protein kinase
VDIKELKLLGEFDHSNIVRFVSIYIFSVDFTLDLFLTQLGVSIPENTKETPVMVINELCSNGDLFDYIRNVPPPKLHKVVSAFRKQSADGRLRTCPVELDA